MTTRPARAIAAPSKARTKPAPRAEAKPPRMDLVIVGRGRVGRALARRAGEAGLSAVLLAGRSERLDARARDALSRARAVWITVPDPHIPDVDRRLAAWLGSIARRALPAIAHASGSRSPDVLAACAAIGAPVASAHPIVSFGTIDTEVLRATFLLAGDARATRVFTQLARRLGARPIVRALHGPRYHAALALLANGAAALAERATSLLVTGDPALRPIEAQRALGSLLRSVADNVERVGASAALTGPIARGDADAVERHLAALSPAEREDYASVSHFVLRAAAAALPPTKQREIARALGLAQRSARRVSAR